MGIRPASKSQDKPTTTTAKRRSVKTDFSNLKPLKPGGALGFSNFRDTDTRSTSLGDSKDKSSKKEASDMDSDEDDGDKVPLKLEDFEAQVAPNTMLSPEDAKRQGELADGVQKIRVIISPLLCRQSSYDGKSKH